MSSPKVADLIKQLEAANTTAATDVYIPSLKKIVKFKNLTLKQQKALLKASIDETLTKLAFGIDFYDIIKDNNLESLNPDNLYVHDRVAIAIALRATGIDAEYKIGDKTYNLNDNINNFPSINILLNDVETSIETDNVNIILTIPTLKADKEVSKYALSKLANITAADLKTMISELFIYEVVKFIKQVTYSLNNEKVVVDFNNIKTVEKVSVIENFSSHTTNKILDFIKNYRKVEKQFTKLDDENNVEVDGSFFTI